MFKTVWHIACRQLQAACHHPRIWLSLLFGSAVSCYVTLQMQDLAALSARPLQLLEPLIACFNDPNILTLLFLSALLLLADVPYSTEGDLFVLMRSGRNAWIVGKLLYLAMLSVLYVLTISAASVLWISGNAYSGNLWSYPFYQLVVNGTENRLLSLTMDVSIMENFKPIAAGLCSMLLFTLYLLTCGLLLCLCNLGRRRVLGFSVVGSLHGLGYCGWRFSFVHMFPFTHVPLGSLNLDSVWGTSRQCGLAESWIYFLGSIICLSAAILFGIDYVDMSRAVGEG